MRKMVVLNCFVKDMSPLDRRKNPGSILINIADEIVFVRKGKKCVFYISDDFWT